MKLSPKRLQNLFVLLFMGYVFLALLVAEQDRTISSQRTLIQSLFADSLALNKMKVERAMNKPVALHPAAGAVKAN